MHPLATVTVKQGVVPLDVDVARFGQSTPSGDRRFGVLTVSVGDSVETPQSVEDFFAPGEFLELTDDEKLSRPSFELMNAGISVGSDDVSFTSVADDWLEVPSVEFETLIFDRATDSTRPSNPGAPYQLTPELVFVQSRFGAAARSALRRSGEAKYRTTAAKYRVVEEGWSVVATDDLSVKTLPGAPRDAAVALRRGREALQTMSRAAPGGAGRPGTSSGCQSWPGRRSRGGGFAMAISVRKLHVPPLGAAGDGRADRDPRQPGCSPGRRVSRYR